MRARLPCPASDRYAVRLHVGTASGFKSESLSGFVGILTAGGHPPGVARQHVQLVIYDRSPLTKGKDFSVVASHTWRIADLDAKHMLLRAGIGWGMMPHERVKDDLATGALVELDVPDVASFDYPLDAIYRVDTPPGPAATWLIERFRGQACD